jgi:uncharacterized protein YgfB (UPF0149 family)
MTPDYSLLRQVLRSALPGISPAALHGLISGLLSSGAPDIDAEDIAAALEEDELTSVAATLVERLLSSTREQLGQSDFSFQLLLPSDDERIKARVVALGEWCEAFTTGFSVGFLQPEAVLGAQGREALYDIGQLADLVETADSTEEDEEVEFMELVEYVRMAAAALYQQLAMVDSTAAAESSGGPDSPVLH